LRRIREIGPKERRDLRLLSVIYVLVIIDPTVAIINKTFRIFVSSTFSDMKEERNALQRDVFPELKKLCMQHGYRFQAIDLRWGVREESALDQQTMNICLDEVARCQRPPNPNFIVLLGDRYGWQPLPVDILSDEFTQIEKQVLIAEDKNLLKSWYKRDDNAVPAVYCVQPRKAEVKANAFDSEKKSARDEESILWGETEQKLREILRNAIKKISLTDEQKLKYISSATEQEIAAGAFNVSDAEEHVFGFFREIEGLPQDESAEDYIDLINKEGKKLPDTGAKEKLDELKEKLIEKTGKDNIFEYEADWKGNGVTTEHIKKLCDDVYSSLSKIIEKEISLIEDKPLLEREIEAHDDFGKERAEVFVGRVEILNTIQDYIRKADKHPLAVYGESGTGKSALMAYSLQQTHEKHPEAEVIFRFIGATPESSDGRALLESLCRQISLAYGEDESSIPSDYKELVEEFPKRLALATAEKSLIIFLDALDQLSDANNARNLVWLPAELPENVRLIVSTLPGECYEILKGKIPEESLRELEAMLSNEGEQLLDLWLNDAKRALKVPQRKEILDHLNRKDNGKPLYLKLAFEESRRWKSYTEKIKLSPDIRGVIQDLFKRLSSDENHGEMMVSRSLGYLAAAKNGLTEDELIDVLSEDKEVFDDFKKRSFHEPPEQRLPVVIWSRLYFDLEPYLTERSSDGASLMTFYHPTTFGAKVGEEFLSGENKKIRHQELSEYFDNQSLYIKRDNEKTPNLRKLSELPFQETYSSMWNELYNTLTDTEFLELKNTHFTIYDLLDDYRTSLGLMPKETVVSQQGIVIQAFKKVLDQASFVLKVNPELTFPQLFNRLQWQFEKNSLLKNKLEFEKNRFKKPWLHLLNGDRESADLVRTFTGHTSFVYACAFSPDGSRIVSASSDYTLKLWDTETGEEIFNLLGHTSNVGACAFSPNGKRIVSASHDNTLKMWDVETGEEICSLKGHTGSVGACIFSPDGSRIVSASDDKTLKIWDVETGEEICTLIGHDDSIVNCAFCPDGKSILSASWDQTLKLWDAETGEKIFTFQGHTWHVNTCNYSPDGSRIVSGSRDTTLKLWDTKTGEEICTLKGHDNNIVNCAFSPDGKRIISASDDNTLKLWDTETGEDICSLKGHTERVEDCAFSPNGKLIVSASEDETLRLWDGDTGTEISTLIGHTKRLEGCAFSPDGRHIVSCSYDTTLKLWDVGAEMGISKFEGHTDCVNSCVFSPDGTLILTASSDKSLKLWDAETGEEISTLRGHSYGVSICEFSLDGSRIVSCSYDENLKLWDVEAGEEISTFKGHADMITSCEFSVDGQCIVSASRDKTLKLWDVETGDEICTFKGHDGFVEDSTFSPDGRLIVSASEDKTLKLWDTETNEEISTLRGHKYSILSCAFSPDGRLIISASHDSTLKLWDVETCEEIYTLKGHTDIVAKCFFSPDGRRIVSCSHDGTLKLWDVETGEEMTTLKGHSGIVANCAFSSDGLFITSSSLDKTFKLWDTGIGEEISSIKGGYIGSVACSSISPDGSRIVIGDEKGQVLLIHPENIKQFLPIVNAVRVRNYSIKPENNYWDINITTTCLQCGKRFLVSDKILDAIVAIYREVNISLDQSPCLHLPNEVWEDPCLLSECLYCQKPLRFNPFIVDNKDRDQFEHKKKDHLFPFTQGNTYFNTGKIEEAIIAFKEAIRIKPDYDLAYYKLGMAYRKSKRIDEAIIAFKEAIRLKSDYGYAHYNLGLLHHQKGNHNEAVISFEDAIKINSKDELAYYNLGMAYISLKHQDKAISAYKEAIKLNPEYEPAYFWLGSVYEKNGQLGEAKEAFKNARRVKENENAYFNMGLAYKAEGSTALAKYCFKRALELGYEKARAQLDELEP